MAKERKRKSFGKAHSKGEIKKSPAKRQKNQDGGDKRKKNSGPRLPSALRKEVEDLNPSLQCNSSDDEIMDSENENNIYEYEEEMAEEELKNNHRFDPVENYEYELPEDYEDEDVPSEDDDEEDVGDENDGRHGRMLESVIGMPVEAFKGKKRQMDVVVSEAYPESEYNPTGDILAGDGKISLEAMLNPLKDTPQYNNLRNSMQLERKILPVQAPLPKPIKEKEERKAAATVLKRDITKWEGLVKRNREAPTIYFDSKVDLGFSSVGAIASEFKPRTELEKKIASLMHGDEVMEAYKNDGSRLLELNQTSFEDVKERQNRLAKLRSILFRHEVKAKRLRKIKSKAFHRLKNKEKAKKSVAELQNDPEAARELALVQEYKRAEERMTLRHKNNKWSRHVKEHHLDVIDERTRAAVSEQFRRHQALTRRMNSMNDATSTDDNSSDDDCDDLSDVDNESKLLAKAREKTLKLMEEEDGLPQSGLLSLPFMARALEKKRAAANEEIKHAADEFELLQHQGGKKGSNFIQEIPSSGRRMFAGGCKQVEEPYPNPEIDIEAYNSDGEEHLDMEKNIHLHENDSTKDVDIDLSVLREDLDATHDTLLKCTDAAFKGTGSNVGYEVSICSSGSRKKMDSGEKGVTCTENDTENYIEVVHPAAVDDRTAEEVDEDSETDSEGQMIDGILSSGPKQSYELPSQEELIRRAFAGDDVEVDFEEAKQEVLNEENPEPEKPKLIPGWGQWTDVQNKRGLPSWMLREHENASKKKEEDLKKRKDARLKHVVISEKADKKEEKLHAQALPYPFTSKEVHDHSIRMPLGPEYNPATAYGALNRPDVVKRPGVIIKPIKYEVDSYGKVGEGQKQRKGKRKPKSKVNVDKSAKSTRTNVVLC